MRGENPFAPRQHGHFERITDRVLLWRNIVNSTVILGDRGVAVIDTQVNPALAKRLLSAIARDIRKPVLWAINTHYHWDHTSGNRVFADAGATLMASRRTAVAMIAREKRQKDFLASRGFELGDDPLQPAVQDDALPTIDLGGVTLAFIPGLRAETADPTLVWCPEEQVLASGDTVMTGSFPIFGQPSQREGLEDDAWLAALDQVRSFGAVAVTPGHGPVARSEDLDLLERICRYFLDTTRAHHAAGRTLAETIRRMEDDLPAWITRMPEVWGTPRYAILRVWAGLTDLGEPGWQHVKPSAIPRPATPPTLGADWSGSVASALEGGDHAAAIALSEAATAAHPDDPAAWTLLARAMVAASRSIASVLEKGDCFLVAKQALARALALSPGYGPALLQAGQFQVMMAFRNGDDPGAGERLLDEAGAWPALTTRERAEQAFYRGMAARARDQEEQAQRHFRAALGCDPGFRPALLASMA